MFSRVCIGFGMLTSILIALTTLGRFFFD